MDNVALNTLSAKLSSLQEQLKVEKVARFEADEKVRAAASLVKRLKEQAAEGEVAAHELEAARKELGKRARLVAQLRHVRDTPLLAMQELVKNESFLTHLAEGEDEELREGVRRVCRMTLDTLQELKAGTSKRSGVTIDAQEPLLLLMALHLGAKLKHERLAHHKKLRLLREKGAAQEIDKAAVQEQAVLERADVEEDAAVEEAVAQDVSEEPRASVLEEPQTSLDAVESELKEGIAPSHVDALSKIQSALQKERSAYMSRTMLLKRLELKLEGGGKAKDVLEEFEQAGDVPMTTMTSAPSEQGTDSLLDAIRECQAAVEKSDAEMNLVMRARAQEARMKHQRNIFLSLFVIMAVLFIPALALAIYFGIDGGVAL